MRNLAQDTPLTYVAACYSASAVVIRSDQLWPGRPTRSELLEVIVASMSSQDSPEQFRGWLLKWTNYIKGYQRRWFVLSNGLLSYYR